MRIKEHFSIDAFHSALHSKSYWATRSLFIQVSNAWLGTVSIGDVTTLINRFLKKNVLAYRTCCTFPVRIEEADLPICHLCHAAITPSPGMRAPCKSGTARPSLVYKESATLECWNSVTNVVKSHPELVYPISPGLSSWSA